MVEGEVTVVNDAGLHLRPAGVLTKTAVQFKSDIFLYHGDRKIIAKSVLNVMAAGVQKGAKLRVTCEGPDEQEALHTVIEAISTGLGEGVSYSTRIGFFDESVIWRKLWRKQKIKMLRTVIRTVHPARQIATRVRAAHLIFVQSLLRAAVSRR